jgi:hypothetical protein
VTAQSEKARDDDYPDILPEDSRTDFALEAAAAAVSILPGLGGAIANVLTGWSAERKRERVREVLGGLALRLAIITSSPTLPSEYDVSDPARETDAKQAPREYIPAWCGPVVIAYTLASRLRR